MALHRLGRLRAPSEPADVAVSLFVDRPTYARLIAHIERAELDLTRDDARDEVVCEALRDEAAVVEAHEREIRAYLGGDVPANQWRPRVYAEAALRAAFDGVVGTDDEEPCICVDPVDDPSPDCQADHGLGGTS